MQREIDDSAIAAIEGLLDAIFEADCPFTSCGGEGEAITLVINDGVVWGLYPEQAISAISGRELFLESPSGFSTHIAWRHPISTAKH